MSDPYVTRKEIASRRRISDDTVARRERKWGLQAARDKCCQRPIRYRADHPAVRRLMQD